MHPFPKKEKVFATKNVNFPVWFRGLVSDFIPTLRRLGYKKPSTHSFYFLQAGTHTHTSQPLHNFGVDRLTHSYFALLNMVQIKPFIAFFLAAVAIVDVVAQPIAQPDPFRGMGMVRGAVR